MAISWKEVVGWILIIIITMFMVVSMSGCRETQSSSAILMDNFDLGLYVGWPGHAPDRFDSYTGPSSPDDDDNIKNMAVCVYVRNKCNGSTFAKAGIMYRARIAAMGDFGMGPSANPWAGNRGYLTAWPNSLGWNETNGEEWLEFRTNAQGEAYLWSGAGNHGYCVSPTPDIDDPALYIRENDGLSAWIDVEVWLSNTGNGDRYHTFHVVLIKSPGQHFWQWGGMPGIYDVSFVEFGQMPSGPATPKDPTEEPDEDPCVPEIIEHGRQMEMLLAEQAGEGEAQASVEPLWIDGLGWLTNLEWYQLYPVYIYPYGWLWRPVPAFYGEGCRWEVTSFDEYQTPMTEESNDPNSYEYINNQSLQAWLDSTKPYFMGFTLYPAEPWRVYPLDQQKPWVNEIAFEIYGQPDPNEPPVLLRRYPVECGPDTVYVSGNRAYIIKMRTQFIEAVDNPAFVGKYTDSWGNVIQCVEMHENEYGMFNYRGADFNCDMEVDVFDLAEFVDHWLETMNDPNSYITPDPNDNDRPFRYKTVYDLSQDGDINLLDFTEFSREWMKGKN